MKWYSVVYKLINIRAHNGENLHGYIENFFRHIEKRNIPILDVLASWTTFDFMRCQQSLKLFTSRGNVKRCRPENEPELFNYMSNGLATITREDHDGYNLHTKT
ncbi:hypothetical protein RF11_02923 [Thelohanellus kitauei]|uniref:Uncharacterized protein n=1 Tax=Thelohanellus kitauei TaxID=669202 RepID=A0A0C2MPU4_THEKT|nr:hypothetical protein RF11_02923 [Thelohanellus kitauei]